MRTFLKILGWLTAVIAFVIAAIVLIPVLKRYSPTVTTPSPIRQDVSAELDWQNTEIFVPAGSTLIIEQRSGMWSECEPYGCPYKDANGNPESSPNQGNNYMQGCLHASLIGRISTTWFCVGSSLESQIEESGYLSLRINDSFLEDNEGTIVVDIFVK